MAWFVKAEKERARRQGVRFPEKTRRARACLEPPFNLIGLLVRVLGELLPPQAMLEIHEKAFTEVAKPFRVPFTGDGMLARAREEADRIEKETGKRAALLCLTSHFPVTEEHLNANPEMMRHVMKGLAAARGRGSRPRLLVAVDPFALELVGLVQEAAYAGFMGTYHLGIDRMFSSRTVIGRALLEATAWPRASWRLVSALRAGGEIGMVLAGGVPRTARVLYTVRERMWLMRRDRQGIDPRRVLTALGKDSGFEKFCANGPCTPKLRRSAWRLAEAFVISALLGQWGGGERALDEVDKGRLNGLARSRLELYARSLGLGETEGRRHVEELEREYARETPYRERFFRMIARRVVASGTPVVLMSLSHSLRDAAKPELHWGEPVSLLGADREEITVRAADTEKTESFARFIQRFASRFP